MSFEKLVNWTPCNIQTIQSMAGHSCTLELFTADIHKAGLYDAISTTMPRDWYYIPVYKPTTDAEFDHWIARYLAVNSAAHLYVIRRKNDSQICGIICFLRIDAINGVLEIGNILFFDNMKKTTIGTEAVFLMLSTAFESFGCRRVEWKCDSKNSRSIAAAIRFGFKFEGIFRKAIIYKSRNRDTAWFAMIDDQWLENKQGFLRWLSQDNFNTDGIQINKLSL